MGDELLEVFAAQPVALRATRGTVRANSITTGGQTNFRSFLLLVCEHIEPNSDTGCCPQQKPGYWRLTRFLASIS